ncbi:hypothetical protein ACFVAV_07540 [Nocardia sp. NPDC057663]|uniref:hypothetical protein n=1 Tax=Nocardia sp. NPDC057663 TaxID=3346201 RepID=UPI0036723411
MNLDDVRRWNVDALDAQITSLANRVTLVGQEAADVSFTRTSIREWTGSAAVEAFLRFDELDRTLLQGRTRDNEVLRRWRADLASLEAIKERLARLDQSVEEAGLKMDNIGQITATAGDPSPGVDITQLERDAESILAAATALDTSAAATFTAVSNGTLL